MADEKSILEQLDQLGPPLKQFDAFPKLPASYKARSRGRGVLTIFIILLSIVLVLNDVAEYIWGWTDYEFSVDRGQARILDMNVDLVVAMPCQYLSVDLRDAVGDRLHLSNTFRRDGTIFDVGQAQTLDEHRRAQSTREIVASSRRSRGFFSIFMRSKPTFKPTYNHKADGSACRVYGSVKVKKITGNLHITTAGHGYGGYEHVDHSKMNLSHVITKFSFGPYFPDITQPLDYSLELAHEPFIAYQYFLSIVPTTYVAPRSPPLITSQYSVTHYVRPVVHGNGTPGIFFKFDLDPLAVEVNQRTTSFIQFFVRVIGVVGGVWVCFGWGLKVAGKVTDKVGLTNLDGVSGEEILSADISGRKKNWRGADLRSRKPGTEPPWTAEGGSVYSGTPMSAAFSHTGGPGSQYGGTPASPYFPGTPSLYSRSAPPPPSAGHHTSHFPPSPLPGQSAFPPSPLLAQSAFPPSPVPGQPTFLPPGTPGSATSHFPSSPAPGRQSFGHAQGNGGLSVPGSPAPGGTGFGNGVGLGLGVGGVPPPPRRGSMLREGSVPEGKKDD